MGTSSPERIIGRYALFREIASGGMASVHLGRLLGPVGFSRVVAIKRLHPHLARDPEFVTMFIDEARLAARVQHPNVVPTLDVVALDGELFIVMEYVDGESLARLSRLAKEANHPLPLPVICAVMVGTLSGLHAAHEARGEGGAPLQLVHRDVSPQNILVGADGLVRVVDFGIAMATGRSHRTAAGVIKGKLRYMAPEQVRLELLDRRTDVYGAAIVLWELLTGRRPFEAANDYELADQIRTGAIAPPSAQNPEVSATLDAIVLKGCAKDPDDRYATAAEMAEAIIDAAPCAIAGTIGRLVQTLAAEALARRRGWVDAAESVPSDPRAPGVAAGDHDDEAPTTVATDEASQGEAPTLALSDGEAHAAVRTETRATRPGGAFVVQEPEGRAHAATEVTLSSWSAQRLRARLSPPVIGVAIGGVLGLIVLVLLLARRTPEADAVRADETNGAARTTSPPRDEPRASPPAAPATLPAPAAPPTPSASVATPEGAPSAGKSPRSVSGAPPKPKSKSDPCAIPFHVDPKTGEKHFRPECF